MRRRGPGHHPRAVANFQSLGDDECESSRGARRERDIEVAVRIEAAASLAARALLGQIGPDDALEGIARLHDRASLWMRAA